MALTPMPHGVVTHTDAAGLLSAARRDGPGSVIASMVDEGVEMLATCRLHVYTCAEPCDHGAHDGLRCRSGAIPWRMS